MVAIAAPAPFMLRDVEVTVDGDDYAAQLSSIAWTPSSSQTTWQGLKPSASVSESSPTTWTAAAVAAQDWTNPDSFVNYCLAHEGESVPCTFRPRVGEGPSFTATLSIAPPAIGGAVGTMPEATITMGSTKPVLVPAP